MRFLIVGAGIAGTTAAEELRKRTTDAEIILIGQEETPLYSRVLLPVYLEGKCERERVFLKKEEWYEQQRIEWLRGLFVESVDTKNKHVTLSDRREISYDKLLITTGGEPRKLAGEPRGVAYLHTLADADHLLQLMREKGSGARAVVYGGNFIAAEFINVFVRAGLKTTMAFRAKHQWSKSLDEQSGELVASHLRAQGVLVLSGRVFEETKGEREITEVVTDKETVACDLLGVGLGTVPELDWLHGAGIKTDDGILTNEFLQTSAPDVYAAGDVARTFDVYAKRHLRQGNWLRAFLQGRAAAANMLGEKMKYEHVASYAINLLGLEIIFVGDVEKAMSDEVKIEGSEKEGFVTQWLMRGGKTVGATIIGKASDRQKAVELIKQG